MKKTVVSIYMRSGTCHTYLVEDQMAFGIFTGYAIYLKNASDSEDDDQAPIKTLAIENDFTLWSSKGRISLIDTSQIESMQFSHPTHNDGDDIELWSAKPFTKTE